MEIELSIRPNNTLALVDFAELWRYRDLLSMLVWRDFAVKYKQTLLGPVWFLLQPLLPALMFTLIFGRLARMSTDGLPGFLFFLCNQVIWGYFAANFSSIGKPTPILPAASGQRKFFILSASSREVVAQN
jgi:lipopolysaccharide transport system permease protein